MLWPAIERLWNNVQEGPPELKMMTAANSPGAGIGDSFDEARNDLSPQRAQEAG
jgi:hypothetical protein